MPCGFGHLNIRSDPFSNPGAFRPLAAETKELLPAIRMRMRRRAAWTRIRVGLVRCGHSQQARVTRCD